MRMDKMAMTLAALTCGLGVVGMGGIGVTTRDDDVPLPRPKRRTASPGQKPDHPAMPEGGWPESRQVRRARLRKENSDAD